MIYSNGWVGADDARHFESALSKTFLPTVLVKNPISPHFSWSHLQFGRQRSERNGGVDRQCAFDLARGLVDEIGQDFASAERWQRDGRYGRYERYEIHGR